MSELSSQKGGPPEAVILPRKALRSSSRTLALVSKRSLMAGCSPRVSCCDWIVLMDIVAAALHHGGAGTVGASLRAGLPTLIKPWFGDQHFW
jgi:hypothetical protein